MCADAPEIVWVDDEHEQCSEAEDVIDVAFSVEQFESNGYFAHEDCT